MKQNCRWGILGTATIARKNWGAIFHSQSSSLTAVASRDLRRAKAFVALCQTAYPFEPIPHCHGNYASLLEDDDVDAVYLPLPTGVRSEWAIRTAEAGKHVLIEKPCAPDSRQLSNVIAACRANNVQFMDGVMFMHSRRLPELRRAMDDVDQFGKLRRIDTNFCFHADEHFLASNIRADIALEPLGCLGDLGWYCIRLILWTLNWQLPLNVTGQILRTTTTIADPLGVPLEFRGELQFQDDATAGFYCSFVTAPQQWFVISGTRQTLQASDYVLPSQGNEVAFWTFQDNYEVSDCNFIMDQHRQRHAVEEDASGSPNAQESQMFQRFADLACSGQRDWRWSEMSLLTQQVMDAMLHSAQQNEQSIALA